MVHDDMAHAGFHRAFTRLVDTVYLHRMARRLRKYIDACPQCEINQVMRHKPYGALNPIQTLELPYHTVAMDFIVALPRVDDYDTLLTCTCKASKKVVLVPGKTTWTARDWAAALLDHWQLVDWGIPRAIISDRDPKFRSEFWKGLFHRLRSNLLMSTAYHPQTDGQSERTNQIVEIALRFLTTEYATPWTKAIPALTITLNNSTNKAMGMSPNEYVMGTKAREIPDLVNPAKMEKNREQTILDREMFR